MATMSAPEIAGAMAVFGEGGERLERPIIGWDEEGYPLVMCGDKLCRANDTYFKRFNRFIAVERLWILGTVTESIADIVSYHLRTMFHDADSINVLVQQAIREAIREHFDIAAPGKDNT